MFLFGLLDLPLISSFPFISSWKEKIQHIFIFLDGNGERYIFSSELRLKVVLNSR